MQCPAGAAAAASPLPPLATAVTQHIALTIGEEVDLHSRLLEELDEDVDVTHSRLRAATKRVRHVLKHSSNWKFGMCICMLMVVLTLLLLIVFKVIKLFK
jgi:SYP5 family syntaxin